MERTAKWQPVEGTKENLSDKDRAVDVLNEAVWQDPARSVAWKWVHTKFGLRLAFKLRGVNRIEYVSLSRDLPKEEVSNPVLQLFELTRDSMRNGLKMSAGTQMFFVIGSNDVPERREGMDDEEGQEETLKAAGRTKTNGVKR